MDLNFIKNQCLIFDIETYAEYPDGYEVNIQTAFDDYVRLAQIKFIGFYSYKYNKEYYFEVSNSHEDIQKLIKDHTWLIGFNNQEFDYPILVNNGLDNDSKKFNQIDCMKILGASSFKDKQGYKYKGRGDLMGYKFKKNSLKCMAETMELSYQKSTIDYHIFKKDVYTDDELKEIIHYLKNDIMSTKGLFDKLWDYWKPFTEMIPYQDIINLSWIKSSIASLIYKSACNTLNTEATYGNDHKTTEEMGGKVIIPKYEEARKVWYIDFGSMYPHIFCMFNLFAECDEKFPVEKFHGNDLFKVKGYYDISYEHPLSIEVQKKLKERIHLKETDPKNPLTYTLKIWLNGLYGVIRSSIFEKVYKPNAGWDCCWLGQQIQKLTEDMLTEFGFETIYGDTDSLFCVAKEEKYDNEEYVKQCLKKVVVKIFSNVPFPIGTYNINLEKYLPYVLFAFSEQPIVDEVTGENIKIKNRLVKHRIGNKKNYAYLYNNNGKLDFKIVGLALIKDTVTPLGKKIYEEVLKPKILEAGQAKFPKEFINQTLSEYLKKDGILDLLATEYKIKSLKSYKTDSIQAQASKKYFNGGDGVLYLIKNNRIGDIGKGAKYCTVEEAKEGNVTLEDLDLEKVFNELEPFIIYVPEIKAEKPKKERKPRKKKEPLTNLK